VLGNYRLFKSTVSAAPGPVCHPSNPSPVSLQPACPLPAPARALGGKIPPPPRLDVPPLATLATTVRALSTSPISGSQPLLRCAVLQSTPASTAGSIAADSSCGKTWHNSVFSAFPTHRTDASGAATPPMVKTPVTTSHRRAVPRSRTAQSAGRTPLSAFSLRSPVPRIIPKNWHIVVTGHSLGAGVAVFVLLWLKLGFPQAHVKAWLFGCPAGLMGRDAADVLQPWCTQVVLGKDLISRLSMDTFHRLRDEMVSARCGVLFRCAVRRHLGRDHL
jgi:hypothetical protein